MPASARARAALLAALVAGGALAVSPPLPRRLLVVSFDGLGGLDLLRRESAGDLSPDGFARARREGFSADRLETVTPSLTAVMHASLETGARPERTGIPTNWFHPAGAPAGDRVSGFDVQPDAETLWEAAARDGRRVAALGWPGIGLQKGRGETPVALRYASEWGKHGYSVRVDVASRGPDATAPLLPPEILTFSPPRAIEVPNRGSNGADPPPYAFVAIDGTDDGRRDYDELVVLRPGGGVRARARRGDWLALEEIRDEPGGDRDVRVGRWVKVIELAPDLSTVHLYLGPEGRTVAQPEDFRRTLDRVAGFWPGPPDDDLLEGANPDTATFVEQSRRFAEYFAAAWEVAARRADWDLLLAYQPGIDQALHALNLVSPDQPGYTRERAERYAAAVREIARTHDQLAARYLRFASRGDVVFVSDHGMRAISRGFFVLEYLRRIGLVKAEKTASGRLRVAADSPVDGSASGGSVILFVNRASLPGGVVPETEVPRVRAAVAKALREARDEAGRPAFEIVAAAGDEMRALGLDHLNSGDVFATTAGPTVPRSALLRDGAPLFGPADAPGQHGFGPDPELDGIFFHVGAGIVPERRPVFRAVDVAARVAGRLGIPAPGSAR